MTDDRRTASPPSAPPFNPDDNLMADMEGNTRAVAAYKREAAALRAAVNPF